MFCSTDAMADSTTAVELRETSHVARIGLVGQSPSGKSIGQSEQGMTPEKWLSRRHLSQDSEGNGERSVK